MHYIGLMSGTSVDGIDAVLVSISANGEPVLVATHAHPISPDIRSGIQALMHAGDSEIDRLGEADMALGELFAEAAQALIRKSGMEKKNIRAIGSHGQTLRHRPRAQHPFTLQIGNPAAIAEHTGITTVGDFRSRDMAAGGQGAPLVSAFHRRMFHSQWHSRAIVNIGGIANITYLPADDSQAVSGFDTGPGNTLLDQWIGRHHARDHDEAGQWAASGKLSKELLESMLTDPYFEVSPPKSTGRETFHLDWLHTHLKSLPSEPSAVDVQATLLQLTALSIAQAVLRFLPQTQEVYICGGGAHNRALMSALTEYFSGVPVATTEALGLHPDWVEATAFAWLAHRTLEGQTGNLPSVTGARRAVILGGIYPA
ncbi:MAG: anhydro-N-acetylmuramic acid kinase [Sulfuricaulis sp.]